MIDANDLLAELRRVAGPEYQKVTLWIREDPDDPRGIFFERLALVDSRSPALPGGLSADTSPEGDV